MATLGERRERARNLATRIVSGAIMLAGVTLLVFAFFLTFYGGAAYIFLSVIVGIGGLGLGVVGFFFQLVPLRLEELAQQKRDYDARRAAESDTRLSK